LVRAPFRCNYGRNGPDSRRKSEARSNKRRNVAHSDNTVRIYVEATWTPGVAPPRSSTGAFVASKFPVPSFFVQEWIEHIGKLEKDENADVEPSLSVESFQRKSFTIIGDEEGDDTDWKETWGTDGIPEPVQVLAKQDKEAEERISEDMLKGVHHVRSPLTGLIIAWCVEAPSSTYSFLRCSIPC
jgi:hypothetical protein